MMKWSVVGIALVAATQLWAQVPPMPDAGDAPNHPGMHMPHADAEPKDADAGAKDDKPADLSVTHHALKMNGQTIRYTATAGTLPMRDDAEKITASMFLPRRSNPITTRPNPSAIPRGRSHSSSTAARVLRRSGCISAPPARSVSRLVRTICRPRRPAS
jgi:hypothetical protein